MGRDFSVDWLAESHYRTDGTEAHHGDVSPAWASRPHIPCMVQPRPPTFGNGHLQLKYTKDIKADAEKRCASSPGSASLDSQSSGYSSGEESKARITHTEKRDETQRRVRTKFSAEQISSLEAVFDKHKYLDVVERVRIAEKLELSETQIRTWFQNRRMKLKRVMQERLANTFPHEKFQRLLPVHYHGVTAPQFPQPYYQSIPVQQMGFQPRIPQHYLTHYPPPYYG